jgi:transposase
MFERNGVHLTRGSMAHWMIRAAEACQPLMNLLEEDLIERPYAQMDETTTQVLKETGKKPQTKSYMWVRTSPDKAKPIVLFDYDPTRSGEVPKRLMQDFKGLLQCDGYDGYNKLEANPGIIRFGCMAHARRKFKEASTVSKTSIGIAKHALKLIQKLYNIETITAGYSTEEKFKARQEKAKPIFEDLKLWVERHLHKVPPKSTTGKALMYFQNERVYLERYLNYGEVFIDNNFIENKIRPFAVGRNRWLFSDSVDGAKASATLYSLVETAKANSVEPYKYLRHIFEKLPQALALADYEELLPWNAKV